MRNYAILCDDYAIQQFSYGLTHNYAIKFLMTKHHRIIYYAILCDIMRYYAILCGSHYAVYLDIYLREVIVPFSRKNG